MATWQVHTDEHLVQKIGKGHTQALAELVRRHQQRALHLAFRSVGDWHLAEDVVQEAFLRVNRAASKYTPDAKFSTWFYRIVVNLCMDELRRGQRHSRATTQAMEEGQSFVETPVHAQEVAELQQAVHRALGQLNERERVAVILHRFEGQSHEQIAEIMEASVSAVESLLVRSYRKLRQILADFSNKTPKKTQGPGKSGV
ncbi:MAG: sigma-70 family RNA polymerase sigma factor [Phycisphaerae bacterium]|nr:sigma-70 family RNA polymerase sigma factor [Phycisphaerae bacterium]